MISSEEMREIMREVERKAEEIITAATDARLSLPPLPANPGPVQVQERLVDLRARLDQVEADVLDAVALKYKAQRVHGAADMHASEGWNTALSKVRKAPSFQGGEYTGPRERYAEADLETFDLQRARRFAELAKSFAEEAHVVAVSCQRGLDSARQDCLALLRSFAFESTLDR